MYKAEPTSPKEIAVFSASWIAHCGTLKVEGISDDLRFQAAYNGILTLTNIALRANGVSSRRLAQAS